MRMASSDNAIYEAKSAFLKGLLPMWRKGEGVEGTGRKCAILNGMGTVKRCSSVWLSLRLSVPLSIYFGLSVCLCLRL